MSLLATRYLRQTFCSLQTKLVVRNFITSGPIMKDIIRDLYIEELKSYKPKMEVDSDVSQVKKLKLPDAPKPPIVDEDISSELAAYEVEDLPPPGEVLAIESFEKKLFAKEEATHSH